MPHCVIDWCDEVVLDCVRSYTLEDDPMRADRTMRNRWDEMAAYLTEFWNQIMVGLAGLIWLLRLEGRITRLEEQIAHDRANAKLVRAENNAMFKEMRDNSTRIFEQLAMLVHNGGGK